jgi:hypothetical protein
MIATMQAKLVSQLPMAEILAKLIRAGLEPATTAGLSRWKAVELLELIGDVGD